MKNRREIGCLSVELPFASHNGSTMGVRVSNLEVVSSIDLSALSEEEISALKEGMKETIREKAGECVSLAGLRTLFSRGMMIPVSKEVLWDAPLSRVEAENSRQITAVPPERNIFRPVTE